MLSLIILGTTGCNKNIDDKSVAQQREYIKQQVAICQEHGFNANVYDKVIAVYCEGYNFREKSEAVQAYNIINQFRQAKDN